MDRFGVVGNYYIADYEVPAYFYGKGIGKICKSNRFFEGTKQAAEFEETIPEIRELLTKADITRNKWYAFIVRWYSMCWRRELTDGTIYGRK